MADDAEPQWLRRATTDPVEVARVYDDWAAGYDRDLADWDYRAPGLVVDRLVASQPGASPVLDVGCGTGLVGARLRERGVDDIVGIDLSARSLEQAATTGHYRELHRVDLQADPIPFPRDSFAALVCVGVMTYLPDTEDALTEFLRVVAPGGSVLFTQRDDIWNERSCGPLIEAMAADGRCRIESISEPQPYLPNSAELGDIPARLAHLRSI